MDDEPQLIERAKAGDGAAAGEIVERYQRRIYTLCLRILGNADDAEELTQETLVKALTGLERFDGRANLGTWLHRIATNACYTRIRSDRVRSKGRVPWPEGGEPEARSRVQRSDEVLDAGQRQRHVAMALDQIQPEHRVVLVLRDVQGLEYEQVAEVLGVPMGTIKSRLFRARLALRQAIERLESGVTQGKGGNQQ
ncbi:MAG: sigma-70 family RNA polymerase sigma factor [Phycisphaera sp.]|nr:MAG: sigma-70 family RNA polymerase sigma factor [Phycisphaera sp.]